MEKDAPSDKELGDIVRVSIILFIKIDFSESCRKYKSRKFQLTSLT